MDGCCAFGSGLSGTATCGEEREDGPEHSEELEGKVDN